MPSPQRKLCPKNPYNSPWDIDHGYGTCIYLSGKCVWCFEPYAASDPTPRDKICPKCPANAASNSRHHIFIYNKDGLALCMWCKQTQLATQQYSKVHHIEPRDPCGSRANHQWRIDIDEYNKFCIQCLKTCELGSEGKGRIKNLVYLVETYGRICFYCCRPVALVKAAMTKGVPVGTIDHRVPLANEGPRTKANLVLACEPCNHHKRDMSEDDFRASAWFLRRIAKSGEASGPTGLP